MAAQEVASAGWAGPTPRVSVVVPTHNHESFLSDLVASLEKQSMPFEDFEVVIVDDASTDATWSELERIATRTPLRILAARSGRNEGPGAARNAGAAIARGGTIAFTDDDCLPSMGWLEALDRATADGVDLVQGRTLPQPGAWDPWARYIWVTGPTPLFESCNIAVVKAAFTEAGGFPFDRPEVTRGTRPHFGEDVEIGWRIRKAGRKTGYAAAALVHHRVISSTFNEWLAEQRRLTLFPGLVRRVPMLRREFLYMGVFLSKDTARFDLAVIGLATAVVSGRPWVAAFALPWIGARWRETGRKPGRPRPVRFAQLAFGDGLGLLSLLAGNMRDRGCVL